MPDIKTQITIVGAGPVGLLLAILLGRRGKDIVLVDKWPEIYNRPRAVTMDAEVARILASIGIDVDNDPDFENHKELYYWKNAELEDLQIVDWKSLAPSGWHVTYWFNQPQFEARLMAMANDLPSVKIMRGWTADSLQHDDTGVDIEIADTETGQVRQSIRSDYLVGADGANSFVRDSLGIEMFDQGYFFDWLILDMIPDHDYKASPAQWQLCDPRRPTTIVPGGPGRRRWEFMLLPDESKEQMSNAQTAWALLEPWGLTPENAQLERSAVYRFEAKWAQTWVKDRCMIAGDAAHLMPPFAGEGMCAGLRDAVALAWRLTAILDEKVTPDVLLSYESERSAHAHHYIQFSRELGEIICIADPQKAAERDARMMADLAARNHKPITGDLVSLGPGLWCEDTPGAGELSPQGIVRFEGRHDRFDQAVGTGWMILAFNASTEGLLNDQQTQAFKSLGGIVVTVGRPGSGCDVIADGDVYDTWAAQTQANYAIIRPDFYVAATAATSAQLRACLDLILEQLFHLIMKE
ncbi:MAG: bifunctional 3-(3-hydroxy-phenyl)propionate/3-hydroxycinnamic acid hydroxylase [Paracoccaceae bacterium]